MQQLKNKKYFLSAPYCDIIVPLPSADLGEAKYLSYLCFNVLALFWTISGTTACEYSILGPFSASFGPGYPQLWDVT